MIHNKFHQASMISSLPYCISYSEWWRWSQGCSPFSMKGARNKDQPHKAESVETKTRRHQADAELPASQRSTASCSSVVLAPQESPDLTWFMSLSSCDITTVSLLLLSAPTFNYVAPCWAVSWKASQSAYDVFSERFYILCSYCPKWRWAEQFLVAKFNVNVEVQDFAKNKIWRHV